MANLDSYLIVAIKRDILYTLDCNCQYVSRGSVIRINWISPKVEILYHSTNPTLGIRTTFLCKSQMPKGGGGEMGTLGFDPDLNTWPFIKDLNFPLTLHIACSLF